MPLRHARVDDLSILSTIYAAAFYDEDMVGALMHPHRDKYPSDYHEYWAKLVREWYWSYNHQLLVTYTTTQAGEEALTGVGDWIRYGKGWESYWGLWGVWDPRKMVAPALRLRHRIFSYGYPNRAADPTMHEVLSQAMSYSKHLWSGRRDTGWYLNFLAVDPAYQNRGYGRALVAWGIEQAQKENVPASVISGTGKDTFYQRCGFDLLVGRVTDGEGNPLNGKVEGGAVLFCDAKDT